MCLIDKIRKGYGIMAAEQTKEELQTEFLMTLKQIKQTLKYADADKKEKILEKLDQWGINELVEELED